MALIKCPECGKEISDMAQSCPHCGKPLHINPQNTPIIQQESSPTNQQKMVQQPKPKKKGHGCLVSVLIVFLLFGGGLMFAVSRGVKDVQENPEKYVKKSILAKELDMTAEQENAMIDIFQKCGIGEITSISEFQAGENHTSYHLEDGETSAYGGVDNTIVVWVNNETKAIESIYFHDYDVYVDGNVIAPITNYYVNSDNRDKYRTLSQELVKNVLNYPDTAKFPGITSWKFGIKEDSSVIVQSTVSAENAFGQKSTADFQIIFSGETPTSLIIDGVEYIQK